jgi:membrane protease YdiL (CAAX protease family)
VRPDWPVPRFDALSTTLVALLGVYLLVVGPMLGRRLRRQIRTGLVRPGRFYAETLAEQWATVGVALVVVVAAAGVGKEHLGLVGNRPGTWWWTVYAVLLSLAVLGAGVLFRRRMLDGRAVPRPPGLDAILPRTRGERRLALVTAVSAGVCEEIVYRGLLLAVGVGIFGLHPLLAGLLAVLVFTANHLYQGLAGMAAAGAVGFACMGFCLFTGSLIPAILLHVALDVRGLVMIPPRPDEEPDLPSAPAVIRSPRDLD